MRIFAQKSKATQLSRSARFIVSGRAQVGRSREESFLLRLQHTIGNRAVQRLLETNTREVKGDSTAANLARLRHDASGHASEVGAIRAKPANNKPEDNAEQEANRVADKVMRMPAAQLQRACSYQQNDQGQIQTRLEQKPNIGEIALPPSVERVMSSPGQPLDSTTRAFLEPRFGQDFSHVRVHADAPAAESAKAVNAHAYTVGSHVVFGQQEYTPKTQEGLQLLAHELAHVVQQGAQRQTALQKQEIQHSTNYRFDTYRVTERDLSDPDIVARFKALSLDHLILYRNRVSDHAVIDYIDQLLDDRMRAMPLDSLFAAIATEKDPKVWNYIDQWLATQAPTSYEIALGTNKPGKTDTSINISGVSVTVLPDEFADKATFDAITARASHGTVSEITKGITLSDPKWHPRWMVSRGRVTSVRPTIQELKIKTVFLSGTSRMGQSAYGVGTREAEDKDTGRITLAHHEGSHAVCFTQFLRDNPLPVFDGRKGDTDARINEKAAAFTTAMEQYYRRMTTLCGPSVDCTGKKASFCP